MILTLFFVVLVLFVIFIISKGVIVIRQAEEMVIERLGQYREVLGPGLHVIIPGLDRPREIDWKFMKYDPEGKMVVEHDRISRIDLREKVYDFPRQQVITKDNAVIEINGLLLYQIIETKRVVYEVENLPEAVEKMTQTSLRNLVGSMTLDETLASRDKVNHELRKHLDLATDKWGVKVNRIEVQEINPPAEVQSSMEKELRAERDRRAAITEAEGMRKSNILTSEGERQAMINQAQGERESTALRAEGEAIAMLRMARAEAESIQRIREALKGSNADASQYLVAMRYIDALKDMVDGNENKVVFMPYEASGVLGSLGGIKEIFKDLNISSE